MKTIKHRSFVSQFKLKMTGLFLLVLMIAYFNGEKVLAQANPHKNLRFNCEICHVATSWTEIQFSHARTKYPLEDRHKEVDCKSCHNIEDFSSDNSDCVNCHQDIHQAKMGNDCERCHTFRGWEIFDVEEIHANSRFPLMGRHTLVDCWSCHRNQQQGDFALLTTDCIACHQQQYLAAENPNHVGNAFATDCQQCHDLQGWQPAFLPDHDAFFPIFSGEHDGAWSDCVDCHRNPAALSDFTCLECHEHRQAKMDEEHRGITGYTYESTACLSCHPTGGKDISIDNHDTDFFPIFSGAHQDTWQECTVCHVNSATFREVSCTDCHDHEQSKTDSEHAGLTGYVYVTESCLMCHPTGEKGEFREHDQLYFPVFSGTHAGAWTECLGCHKNVNDRKEFACLECHEHRQTEMDAKHAGMQGYAYQSTECYFCHPSGEKGEFREHDGLFFPIFSGAHQDQWDECTICHTNPLDRKAFSCIDCHEHAQTEMDANHAGMPDYTYQSNGCFFCHPSGEKGEFREHDQLFFPIFSGTHQNGWDECLACHPGPADRKQYTCVDCHEHNQTDMDARHAGIPGYVYQSSDCFFCHPKGEKGDFIDHDNQYFPIFSGPHNHKWDDCSTCHFDPTNRKVFTCFNCHEHAKDKMDKKHKDEKDYMYDSYACYDCHPQGKG